MTQRFSTRFFEFGLIRTGRTLSLFFVICLITSRLNNLYGQAAGNETLTPSIANVVPASPDVNAIIKFGNVPVGLSTGIPQVSVPVYSWKGQNFGNSLNVSLEYHAGGIRVDELASSVGLGWALNAGGVISRTMRGTPDELTPYGFLNYPVPDDELTGNGPADVANSDRIFHQMNAGIRDSQNDIFNYSFNGHSGRFVLGKNGDVLFLEQAKLKLEKFTQEINGRNLFVKFILTDEQGFKYEFSDYEITTASLSAYSQYFTSSWYLSKIINPAATDFIRFEYGDTFLYSNQVGVSSTEAFPISPTGTLLSSSTGHISGQTVNTKRLQKITLPDDNILSFQYRSNIRQDVLTGSQEFLLNKIVLSKSGMVRGFLLSQDYSLAGRATLTSVTEFGGTEDNQLKPYTFDYFKDAVLPARASVSVDHWGYANYNTGPRIPHEYFPAPGGDYGAYREFAGGNRDTDPQRIKAGSLVKIIYPTGGYTVFDMEANTARDNWLDQDITVSVPSPPYTEQSVYDPINITQSPASTRTFTFQGESNTTTEFYIEVDPVLACNNCNVKFEFYSPSNALLTTKTLNLVSPNGNRVKTTFNLGNLVKSSVYTIKAYAQSVPANYNGYYEVRWKEINPGTSHDVHLRHRQPYVGGLRAKRISDFLPNSPLPATVKEYDYLLEDGLTSSGTLGFRPTYTYLVYFDYKDASLMQPPSYHGNFGYNYIIRTSNSVNDIAYINGSPVTYSRVVEKNGSNGNYLGKTVRYFTSFSNNPPITYQVFPVGPTDYKSWSYGLLTKEETYDVSGNLVKKIENTYDIVADQYTADPVRVENFRSINIAPVKFLSTSPSTSPPVVNPRSDPHYFMMSSMTPVSGRSQLVQKKDYTFQLNASPVVNTVNYTYDPDNYQLKETKQVNSKGEEKKSVLSYPKDMVSENIDPMVYTAMLSSNIINPVVREQNYTNSVLDFTKTISYKAWFPAVFAPEAVKTRYKQEAERNRIRFLRYDTHGAPLAVQQENGPVSGYVWGYGGDYLVGKISNLDYGVIESALGGAAAVESFRNNRNPADNDVQSFISPLLSLTPSVHHVNQFRYNTMAGMTAQFDPRGYKTSYEYDLFQRLENIKNADGDIVKNFGYNYTTPKLAPAPVNVSWSLQEYSNNAVFVDANLHFWLNSGQNDQVEFYSGSGIYSGGHAGDVLTIQLEFYPDYPWPANASCTLTVKADGVVVHTTIITAQDNQSVQLTLDAGKSYEVAAVSNYNP